MNARPTQTEGYAEVVVWGGLFSRQPPSRRLSLARRIFLTDQAEKAGEHALERIEVKFRNRRCAEGAYGIEDGPEE